MLSLARSAGYAPFVHLCSCKGHQQARRGDLKALGRCMVLCAASCVCCLPAEKARAVLVAPRLWDVE
jgi:hypothetical protein